MTAIGLVMVAAGITLIFSGVKNTDPREMLLSAFSPDPKRGSVIAGAAAASAAVGAVDPGFIGGP